MYFALRREWSAVVAGALGLAAVSGLTAAVLGPEAYGSYVLDVLPRTSLRRADWHNLSLSGVWCKLFDAPLPLPPVEVRPLVQAPAVALLGMTGTLLGVSAVLALAVPRLAASGERPTLAGRCFPTRDTDLAFALAVLGMLLVSPITRDHYLLVLALPLAVLWEHLRGRWAERVVLVLLLAVLGVEPGKVMKYGLTCVVRP